jgi:thiol-disulfide isomerase/thioredoxin
MVLATLCPFLRANAQKAPNTLNLHIGDKMPDVQIYNILNSHHKIAKISDYKGKLLIIDFWGAWCSSCIEGFPKLDSLQKEFSGKIQVLLVNPKKEGDTERGVKIVINRMRAWSQRPFILPVVLQDTTISRNFEFHSIPHCVWISSTGTIIGITDKGDVTSQNIARIIAGKQINMPIKIH